MSHLCSRLTSDGYCCDKQYGQNHAFCKLLLEYVFIDSRPKLVVFKLHYGNYWTLSTRYINEILQFLGFLTSSDFDRLWQADTCGYCLFCFLFFFVVVVVVVVVVFENDKTLIQSIILHIKCTYVYVKCTTIALSFFTIRQYDRRYANVWNNPSLVRLVTLYLRIYYHQQQRFTNVTYVDQLVYLIRPQLELAR